MSGHLLSLGSVPHTNTPLIVTRGQCGLVVWVVGNRAETTSNVTRIHIAQMSLMTIIDIIILNTFLDNTSCVPHTSKACHLLHREVVSETNTADHTVVVKHLKREGTTLTGSILYADRQNTEESTEDCGST